jgi:hypothetical protein
MIDPQHGQFALIVVDLVDDTVRAASSRPQAGELTLERMSDPSRILDESADEELNDGCCGAFRESSE